MDKTVIAALKKAGFDTTFQQRFPVIPIQFDDNGVLAVPGEEVCVMSGKKPAYVKMKSISQLFTGDKKPPSIIGGPTEEYVSFFALIERTAIDFCDIMKHGETDSEFERLYRQLRRRPDGRDNNPMFCYLQAAARLYMSLRDTSQAEFEAVAQRLSLSARHFSLGSGSTNYYRIIREHLS